MEHVIIWEPEPLVKPEFRLYYDDKGQVVCYTCEKPEGNYIVIDAATYAAGRPDIRVIDGKISTVKPSAIVSKLTHSDSEGITCAYDDMSIVVSDDYKDKTQKWKLSIYELE
jgi:hypothetical protein